MINGSRSSMRAAVFIVFCTFLIKILPILSAQMKGMEVTISGSGIDIPPVLTVGQTLPDGSTEVKMGSNGMVFMTMKFDIKNRKVEKKERVYLTRGKPGHVLVSKYNAKTKTLKVNLERID